MFKVMIAVCAPWRAAGGEASGRRPICAGPS